MIMIVDCSLLNAFETYTEPNLHSLISAWGSVTKLWRVRVGRSRKSSTANWDGAVGSSRIGSTNRTFTIAWLQTTP